MDKKKVVLAALVAGLMVVVSFVQVSGLMSETGRGMLVPDEETVNIPPGMRATIAADPANTTAFVNAQIGEPDYLDPAVDYETAGGEVIQNVYETLVWYDRESVIDLVPMLATSVPTIDNGGISEDGMNYTFNIREGVTFHDGTALTAEDVTYSIQRVLRIHDPNGPSWMLEQIMTNYLSFYIGGDLQTYIDDNAPPQWILDAIGETDPAYILTEDDLTAVAESAITEVDSMTVNFRLTRPYPAFIKICAYTVMSIVSKDFVEANGGIANGEQNDFMDANTCGTGPYEFVEWDFGTQIRMTRFAGYWGAAPALEDVYLLTASDEETRMSMLENGTADTALVSIEFESRFDGSDYEVIKGLATFDMTFTGFNMNINTTQAALYGGNVPSDFFQDKNMRLAFVHMLDYDTFITNVLMGNAILPNGVIPKGMFGYDETIPTYEYDLATAADYLKQTINTDTGNSWWVDGFDMALFYNAGNTYRETVCMYLRDALNELTDMAAAEGGSAVFSATVNTLDWPSYLANLRMSPSPFPMFYLGWAPDYADPDDYTTPFLDSVYGSYPHTTGYANASIDLLVRAAAVELDETLRAEMYSDMSMLVYEDAPYMWLWQGSQFHVERSWVEGYYYNPMYSGLYYAALSKTATLGTAPDAEFTVTPSFGDTSTLFVLDATGSSDLEDDASVLEYRWDWEGDGIWDTDWSLDEDATHQYLAADTYTVMLEVRDTGGLVGSASEDVVVSDVAIPEFTTVLIPVVAVLALFVVAMRRREAA